MVKELTLIAGGDQTSSINHDTVPMQSGEREQCFYRKTKKQLMQPPIRGMLAPRMLLFEAKLARERVTALNYKNHQSNSRHHK